MERRLPPNERARRQLIAGVPARQWHLRKFRNAKKRFAIPSGAEIIEAVPSLSRRCPALSVPARLTDAAQDFLFELGRTRFLEFFFNHMQQPLS
jgi:hypothetical protein